MIRYAWRTILRMPAVSAVVVLSLGAGIGINTVVFSWIQLRVFKPLPGVEDSASFYGIEALSDAGTYPGSSWLEYGDLRERLRSFRDILAFRMAPLYVGDAGQVERTYGLLVSGNYFTSLGITPAAGRFFTADETARRGREPVAVISNGLWQRRFAADPAIAGRRLRINGADVAVVGVAPEEFQGTSPGLFFDIWVPATAAPLLVRGSRELDERGIRGYSLLGRLNPGGTRAQAQAELDAAMKQLASAYPSTNAAMRARILTFSESPRGPNRMLNAALFILQAIMLLLLAAVCGNTANLVLARASARQREVGVRLALGAGPWRIASTLLLENVMLAALGGVVGAAIAVWGTRAMQWLPITSLPIRFQTSVDGTTLVFAIALAVLCGLIVGAAPAVQLARLDPLTAFRAGARTSTRSALRNGLMGAQAALALLVLVAAGLFLRSFLDTKREDAGFVREGVLLAGYDLAGRNMDETAVRSFADRLLTRLRAEPGVESAAIAASVPLDIHGLPARTFALDGRARASEGNDEALVNTVTPGYFEVMRIPFLTGQDFAPLSDTASPRQAIVNDAFVRTFVGDGEAVGRTLRVRDTSYVIAGVVRTSLYNAFGEPPTPSIYFSYRDRPAPLGDIHIRTRGGRETAMAPELRAVMASLDPDLPIFNVRSLTDHVDTNLVFRRVPARMFAVLAPLLLVLAAIGIYAVVAYTMSLRRTEIGLRLALGASPGRVVAACMAESMRVIAAGAAIGWLLALIVGSELAGPDRLSLMVFAGVPVLLLAVAAFSCWLPAMRAARLDPWAALKG